MIALRQTGSGLLSLERLLRFSGRKGIFSRRLSLCAVQSVAILPLCDSFYVLIQPVGSIGSSLHWGYVMTYEIHASQWLNTSAPLSLASLRGRVVVVTAFQMLCPGCVINSLPQARKLDTLFSRDDLRVIGLHSVFEHHDVMGPAALQAFVHEYRLNFPIAIDQPSDTGPLPRTMKAWGLGGTPSTIIFDRDGKLALKELGHLDDLRLGAFVGQLIARNTPVQDKKGEEAQAVADKYGSASCGPTCTY